MPVGAGGAFRASVVPIGPAIYRAVAGGEPSLPVRLPVGARLETRVQRLTGGRTAIRAIARPAQVGAPAALQFYSRERYRWRQVAHKRVDRHSRVAFVVSPRGAASRPASCCCGDVTATGRPSGRVGTSGPHLGAAAHAAPRRMPARAAHATTDAQGAGAGSDGVDSEAIRQPAAVRSSLMPVLRRHLSLGRGPHLRDPRSCR